MLTITNPAGRLVSIRWAPPAAESDLTEQVAPYGALLKRLSPCVILCDLRGLFVLPPALAERIRQIMTSDNPNVERSGYLVDDSRTVAMQYERLFREAASGEKRRLFTTASPIQTWLGSYLKDSEKKALGVLLSGAQEPTK